MNDQVLLGIFPRSDGYQYQELLEDAGIEVFVVDTSNQYMRQRSFSNVQLFVAREDQLNAERLIRDFQYDTALKFKELSARWDHKMLALFLLFLVSFVVYVIWTNSG